MVGGVCAALGHFTDVDPVIYRVTFAVLTIFGGAGLVLYLIGWLLIPEAGAPGSAVDRQLHRPGGRPSVPVLIGVGLAVVILAGIVSNNGGAGLALVIVAGIALLASRTQSPAPATSAPPPGWGVPASAYGPGSPPLGFDPGNYPPAATATSHAGDAGPPAYLPYGAQPAYVAPTGTAGAQPAAARPRPRSVLGLATGSVAVVLLGALLLIANLTGRQLSVARVIAAALIVVGCGLLVGAWFGRSRGLIALGCLLTVATLAAAAVSAVSVPVAGGAGNRTWAPASVAELRPLYQLGAGEATLDLSRLRAVDGRHVQARVGLGQLRVLVPWDVDVTVHGRTGAGNLTLFGDDRADRGLERRITDPGVGSTGSIDLDLKVGVGVIEVDRASA